jgi:hypothetical protein
MNAIPLKPISRLGLFVPVLLLAACGSGSGANSGNPPPPPPPAKYTVGGTVTGLIGSGLVLQDNGGDNIQVTANGAFTFPTALANGTGYSVAAFAQPTNPSQSCIVSTGSGTLNGANVTNVVVACYTNSFSVGGTITGLTGSGLVLQDNGGDNLAISASGTFTFAALVASGSAYDVTVLAQPSSPAQTCTVSAGSGTVTNAIITTVIINCTNNVTAGSGFWIPYLATPAANTSGGESGVFLIPSSSLAASPAPTFLSTTASTILGIAWQYTLNGSGTVTTYLPDRMMYAAADNAGIVHIYGVNLSDASSSPAPTQISNLALSGNGSLSALGQICDFQDAQGNTTDPTSLFVFLHIAGVAGCNAGADTYQVVHYTDSATTTPTVALTAEFSSALFSPLYQTSGLLGGVVLVDTSGNLDFLSSIDFAGETVIASSVLAVVPLTGQSANNPSHSIIGASTAFFAATSASGTVVYSVNTVGGQSALVYSTSGTLSHGVADNTWLYFVDTVGGSTPTVKFVQMNLATGLNSVLYSLTPAANTVYDVIGSDGASLVFDATTVGSTTTTKLTSISIAGNANPTALGPTLDGSINAFMIGSAPGNAGAQLVFVDVANVTGSGTIFSYSSEVLTPSGAVLQPVLANSTFLGRTSEFSGAVFQIRGITDTAGGYGGGGLNSLNIANSLASTPFTTTGGLAYAVPQNYGGFLLGLSNTIGAGDLTSGALQTGVAYDISQQLIVPIGMANTNVIF